MSRRYDRNPPTTIEVKIEELHIHIHLHKEDEALLKQIEELQSKVTADTASMKGAVDAAKEGS